MAKVFGHGGLTSKIAHGAEDVGKKTLPYVGAVAGGAVGFALGGPAGLAIGAGMGFSMISQSQSAYYQNKYNRENLKLQQQAYAEQSAEFKGVITMFFKEGTSYKEIQNWITVQLPAVYQASKHGLDIEIKPHRNKRSNQQNRFLYAILVAIIKFHHETGFCPKGVSLWGMRVDVLKIYYKHRFGVGSTSKLDIKTFGQFIDNIQQSLVEESGGEWEVLQPDSAYIQSLLAEGGY